MLSTHARRFEVFALFALVFAAATGVIWIRTETVQSTYLFVKQEKEAQRLQQDLQALRVDWLRLTSPQALEPIARRMDMAPPKLDQTLKISTPSIARR